MITEETTIRPIKSRQSPIMIALHCYRKWKNSWIVGTLWFIRDLIDYLFLGIVISRPDCFGMAKIVDMGSGKGMHPVWFVRFAAGDLDKLLRVLPFYLPQISFCRRNEANIRVYRLDRLVRLTFARQKTTEVK